MIAAVTSECPKLALVTLDECVSLSITLARSPIKGLTCVGSNLDSHECLDLFPSGLVQDSETGVLHAPHD